jgi:hypothetical protein
MVYIQMRSADNLALVGKTQRAQIDRNSWIKLSTQFERVVKSLGLVGHLSELSEAGSQEERARCRVLVSALSKEGHLALRKFVKLWANLNEQVMEEQGPNTRKDFDRHFGRAYRDPLPKTQRMLNMGKGRRRQ